MWANYTMELSYFFSKRINSGLIGNNNYWVDDQFTSNESYLDAPSQMVDSIEPFYIQYEKRMGSLRKDMVQKYKYRLRMYAYATL